MDRLQLRRRLGYLRHILQRPLPVSTRPAPTHRTTLIRQSAWICGSAIRITITVAGRMVPITGAGMGRAAFMAAEVGGGDSDRARLFSMARASAAGALV